MLHSLLNKGPACQTSRNFSGRSQQAGQNGLDMPGRGNRWLPSIGPRIVCPLWMRKQLPCMQKSAEQSRMFGGHQQWKYDVLTSKGKTILKSRDTGPFKQSQPMPVESCCHPNCGEILLYTGGWLSSEHGTGSQRSTSSSSMFSAPTAVNLAESVC